MSTAAVDARRLTPDGGERAQLLAWARMVAPDYNRYTTTIVVLSFLSCLSGARASASSRPGAQPRDWSEDSPLTWIPQLKTLILNMGQDERAPERRSTRHCRPARHSVVIDRTLGRSR